MKKFVIALIAIVLFSIFSSSAFAIVQTADFNISYIGQDPSPVVPGKYVDLTFKAKGGVAYSPSDVTFEVIEKFPFSLEPGQDKIRNLGNIKLIGQATDKNELLFQIRLLVDDRAVEGDNKFEYKYYIGSFSFLQKIKVTISNVRTDFDVVVQEISENSVSLGIVNTGKNSAKSIVVKIPAQKNFDTEVTGANIVGNLESGDFTITTFRLIPKTYEKGDLNVLVSYTDTEGVRHTLNKVVQIQLQPSAEREKPGAQANIGISITAILIVFIILGFCYFAFFKKRK